MKNEKNKNKISSEIEKCSPSKSHKVLPASVTRHLAEFFPGGGLIQRKKLK